MSLLLFTRPAPTGIYTLSLHDALPISTEQVLDGALGGHHRVVDVLVVLVGSEDPLALDDTAVSGAPRLLDRKSTRLNSSHPSISYAVFSLKTKTRTSRRRRMRRSPLPA